MGTLCGILGKRDADAVRSMARAMRHRGEAEPVFEGEDYAVAASARTNDGACLLDGSPCDADGNRLDPAALLERSRQRPSPDDTPLSGSFAAAVRIGRNWRLMRDRLGIKPLYYAETKGALVFASELKGLLASGYVARRLDLASVDRYLTLRCVPDPETIVQNVYRVAPGGAVEYGDGRVRSVTGPALDLEVQSISREDAAARLRELLRDAVGCCEARHLLWSAGIGCAALAALKPDAAPVFVLLKSVWQDEARGASESARLMKRSIERHKARQITENTIANVARCLDEPLADASALPLWLIAEQAAASASVFMTGHGADELLGGYPRFHFMQKAQGAVGAAPVNLLGGILPALPPNAFVRRAGHYLTSIHDHLEAYLSWLAVFDLEEREELYTDTMRAAIHEKGGSAEVLRPYFQDPDLTRNLLALDLNVGLPALMLAKCDRITAAHGIALEFPYLEDRLVDFAIALPPDVKYGVRSKPLLRQAMRDVLPPLVRLRARRDFRMPLSGPNLRVIEQAARHIVTPERVDASGLFRWHCVEPILHSYSHNVYRRRQFWALLMFFAWYREFMEG